MEEKKLKRVTVLAIKVDWDDERQDHPVGWPMFTHVNRQGEQTTTVLSYEDFDEDGTQIGAG